MTTMATMKKVLFFLLPAVASFLIQASADPVPIVIWHGMGKSFLM